MTKKISTRFLAVVLTVLMLYGTGQSVMAQEVLGPPPIEHADAINENSYEVSKEYQFSAQIQKDKTGKIITEFVPFGSWDNKEKSLVSMDDESVITRIKDSSSKGKIGAWYYNVGTYHGTTVDLKCTVADYKQMELEDGTGLGWIGLSKEHLGIYQNYLDWVELKMEFFDGNTGEPLTVKSTAVITDVDRYEGMTILSDCNSLLLSEDCTLKQSAAQGRILFWEVEGKSANSENEDDWAQIQAEFESNTFRYRFYSKEGLSEDKNAENNWIDVSSYTSWNAYWQGEGPQFELKYQGYSDCRLAPLAVNEGCMAVSDKDEDSVQTCILNDRDETFTYKIIYEIPLEHEKWYYDSFVVTSQLPEYLEFKSGNVYTLGGENVTSQFYLRETNGLVTFEAKQKKNRNFYGKTYVFGLSVKVKTGASLDELWDGQYYSLPQQGQVEIRQGNHKMVQTTKAASARIDSEYVDGRVFIKLTDERSQEVLTEAAFTLFEWSERKKAYCEAEIIPYSRELSGYNCEGLKKTHENQGKYRIMESKVPEHYTGGWEQEILVTENEDYFSFEVTHQPSGENLVRMTSVILKADGSVGEETGSLESAMELEYGDRIQYHIYVERDCAISYKSSELLLKDKIPAAAVYDKSSLNLVGEILNQTENSTAKIASVRLDKEGVLTWKINHLDDGEVAHVLFEVGVPNEAVIMENYAELTGENGTVQSNLLQHQLLIQAKPDVSNPTKEPEPTKPPQVSILPGTLSDAKDKKQDDKVILPNETKPGDGNTPNIRQNLVNESTTAKGGNNTITASVQTGDSAPVMLLILIGITSVIVAWKCYFRMRRVKK